MAHSLRFGLVDAFRVAHQSHRFKDVDVKSGIVIEPIVVTQLRYSHISKAVESWRSAFADDPLIQYIKDTPDKKGGDGPIENAFEKAIYKMLLALWIRRRITRTVDKGAALIIAAHAENSPDGQPHKPSDHVFEFVLAFLFRRLKTLGTPQQRQRGEERTTKQSAVIQRTIADRVKDMLLVDGICTSPLYQGRGYGGAILDNVTAIADKQKRAAWLVSSNILNTEFYNSHGFMTVGAYTVGDENPDWHKPPVIVNIMVREPSGLQ